MILTSFLLIIIVAVVAVIGENDYITIDQLKKEHAKFEKKDYDIFDSTDDRSTQGSNTEEMEYSQIEDMKESVNPRAVEDPWVKNPTSIDYSNRICPEYFGLRRESCPDCVPGACIIESDILCPYYAYQACQGKNNFKDCKNVETREFTARSKVISDLWPGILMSGKKVIIIDIEYLNPDEDRTLTDLWWHYARAELTKLEKSSCLLFYERDRVKEVATAIESSRYIKVVETACLCGVNRVGMKPYDDNSTDLNETIIYYPTWRTNYQLKLTDAYDTLKIRHYPYYYVNEGDVQTSCSYFQGSFLHLMLHALGFGHTNNRVDRDNFVFINEDNIPGADYNNIPVRNFFKTDNFDPPEFGSYSNSLPNSSVMFMDPLAWSKYASLATFSPTTDIANPVTWQKQFTEEDSDNLASLFGPPEKPPDPCYLYNNAARSRPTPRDLPDVRNCGDIVESKTTIRVEDETRHHFGAEAHFRCKNDDFVMLGDSIRKCERNGNWSGIQPFCMPPEMVTFYCSFAVQDQSCRRRQPQTISLEEISANVRKLKKRSISEISDRNLIPDSFLETETLRAVSDVLCIGFVYVFQANSAVEVHLEQNGNWKRIWNGMSAKKYAENEVEFETNVENGKEFKLKILGKYDGKIAQEFYVMQMHVLGDYCNYK